MTDSVRIKLRQRATIMLKVCELAESHRPETAKAMTPEDELKVDEIYQLLRRAMDLPPAQAGSTISDRGLPSCADECGISICSLGGAGT